MESLVYPTSWAGLKGRLPVLPAHKEMGALGRKACPALPTALSSGNSNQGDLILPPNFYDSRGIIPMTNLQDSHTSGGKGIALRGLASEGSQG